MSTQRFQASTSANLAWGALRFAYAAWFLFFPTFMLVHFHGHVPGSFGPHADGFLHALNDVGFVEPLLITIYYLGGATLLFRRTAPVGITLLAGPVAMIFLFHMVHTGRYLWGSIWPIGLAALAWRFRHRFEPLWNYKGPALDPLGPQAPGPNL